MITVIGTITDRLLQKVRDGGEPGGDEHAIQVATGAALPFSKSRFNAEKKTVTVEFDEDQFIAFLIEKGLSG